MDRAGHTKKIAVVIVAAGKGSRFGSSIPKQYSQLGTKPLIRHSIDTFLEMGIKDIIVVIHPDHYEYYEKALSDLNLHEPALGGATRGESTLAGLKGLRDVNPDFVLVHDAARPFVDVPLVRRVINGLETSQGVIPAIEVTDTVKLVANSKILQTLPRESLWRAQTPQGFDYKTILNCFDQITDYSFTDEASLLELCNVPVTVVPGSDENVKITFSSDLRGR